MALLEDTLTGNVAKVVAIGAVAVVLPKAFPALPAPLRTVLKSGLKLFAESEADAEGGIIDKLADAALKNVLASLSGPGTDEERHRAAQATIRHFQDTAHHRAGRYGRNEVDTRARYRRHMAGLRRALAGAERGRSQADQDALKRMAGQIEAA